MPVDSDVPGEKPYPTQPFPTKPPAFVAQGVVLDDANNLTPEIKAAAQEQMKTFRIGPIFTPPSLRGTLQRPTAAGGANWGGAAFDPDHRLSDRSGDQRHRRLARGQERRIRSARGRRLLEHVRRGGGGARRSGQLPGGLPLMSPPYAMLTAIDLNRGEIAWRVPLGEGSASLRNHPLLKGVTLPDRLGSPNNRGGALVTGSRSRLHRRRRRVSLRLRHEDRARALADEDSVHEHRRPMTYRTRAGRQFIVMATGAGADNALLAFSLDAAAAAP